MKHLFASIILLLLTTQYMAAQDKQVVNIIHPAYTALREGEQIERVKTAGKSQLIMLPALQGLVKVAEKNFINR